MEAVGSSAAILGVLLGAWITGKTNSLEAAAWGAMARHTTAGVAGAWVVLAWVSGWLPGNPPEWIDWMGQDWERVSEACGIGAVTATAWFVFRLWVKPRVYDHWYGSSERYIAKLWEVVESGSPGELAAVTKKVEKDIRRIVAWSKDDVRGKYRQEWWREKPDGQVERVEGKVIDEAKERASQNASSIIDLMGDDRWASEIVRQGGRLARRVMEEVQWQNAWGVPIGRMMGSVTAQAVEQEQSFLVNESARHAGSSAIMRHRPTTNALYGQREALEVDHGVWIEPGLERTARWGEVEAERWMVVAEKVVKTWTTSGWTGSGFILKRIAGGLGDLACKERKRRENEGKKGKEDAVLGRTARLVRLIENAEGMNEAQMDVFAEAMVREALETVGEVAILKEDDSPQYYWWIRHYVWLTLTWGPEFRERTPKARLAREICKEVWKETGAFIRRGWLGRGPQVLNMLLLVRAGRQGICNREATPAERTERALMRGLERTVKKRYANLMERIPRSAQAMLSDHVKLAGEELVIDQIVGAEPREPVRWKLKGRPVKIDGNSPEAKV